MFPYRDGVKRALLLDLDDTLVAEESSAVASFAATARHVVYEDVEPALAELRESHALALVTNGAPCLQREKLAGSGLAHWFDAVVVSGDLGAGKPDPRVFEHALALLGQPPDPVMVGDTVERDVDGALAAGLDAIWINRSGQPRPADRRELREIASLAELPAILRA